MARELQKISFNIPTLLLDRIDEYADSVGINRTAAINLLISNSLDQQKALSSIDVITKMFKELKGKQIETENAEEE
jgi:metal-responsive CopG/Arc/MetJ family transcriptional regulator